MLGQIAAFTAAATVVTLAPGPDPELPLRARVTGAVLVALGLRLATTSR